MKTLFMMTLLLTSMSAHSFTLNNSAKLVFNKDKVKVNVAGGFCTNIGITDQELLNIVGDAVENFWNRTPTSKLKLQKGSIVNVSSDFYNDQICAGSTNCDPNPDLAVSSDILVTCNANTTNFPNSNILGITIPNNTSGTTIYGSLVMINDRNTTRFSSKTRDEKMAIIAHEIGHAFGLGHSPVTDSLMYYATVSQRRYLGQDDMDGITYLYPKEQPVSCGSIAPIDTTNKPNWWSGLFLGFSIIGLAELVRKKKSKAPRLIA